MVCRSDKLASVAMALVKRDVALDDAQVQSLMHQLRHEGLGVLPDQLHRDSVHSSSLHRLQAEISADPTLRPQRRAGLLDRLEAARDSPSKGSTLHAVEQLRGRANLAEHLLGQQLREIASRSGETVAETRRRFNQLRGEVEPGRKPRAGAAERAQLVGLPRDPATRRALQQLQDQASAEPRPVVTDWVDVHGVSGRVGYHVDSRRLELKPNAEAAVEAFRDVPPEEVERLRDPDPATALSARLSLVGSGEHRYRDPHEAAAAGMAVRCEQCGQFVGDPHTCPVDQVTCLAGRLGVVRDGRGTVLGRTTDPDQARAQLQQQRTVRMQVLLQIAGQSTWARSPAADPLALADADSGTVRGELLVYAEDDQPRLRSSGLVCGCARCRRTGRCRHVAVSERLILAQLAPPPVGGVAGGVVFEPSEDYTADYPPLPPDLSNLRFSQDPQGFGDAVREALDTADSYPTDPVPLISDGPALYGYGADRRFGVEVEYMVEESAVATYGTHPLDRELALSTVEEEDWVWGEIEEQEWDHAKQAYVTRTTTGWTEGTIERPSLDGYEPIDEHGLAAARIGHELYGQDLLEDSAQVEYAAAKNEGYSSGRWSLEKDTSVSGELVSPVMSDRPAVWEQLGTVCATVREHGGTSDRAAAHVHVSAPEYGQDARCATRLLQLVGEHEDDLHRMAHTPEADRNVHQWAAPNPPPPELGYVTVGELAADFLRNRTVNFGSVGQDPDRPEDDHLEFRLFDASLQPGRMQAQVKLAAALTDYAARHRDEAAGPRRPLGRALQRHPKAGQSNQLAHPDDVDEHTWATETAGVRQLIDQLFRRDIDKRQIAALWAVGRYRRPI